MWCKDMKVVSVVNLKGGVGKTTLTANLGAELAFRGKKVLLIDLDAQASLTFSFITPDEWRRRFEADKTIKFWFDAHKSGRPMPLERLIESPERVASRIQGPGRLDIIGSHLGLVNVELELAMQLGRVDLPQSRTNFVSIHRRLADGLQSLSRSRPYDLVLIDCPPNFSIVTRSAIIASDYILVPTLADEVSTLGIDYLMRNIRALIDDYNDHVDMEKGAKEKRISPKIVGVVFTMIHAYGGGPVSAQRNYIAKVRNDSGLHVFKSYIKRSHSLSADAPDYGIPVVLSHHNDLNEQSNLGFEQLATEFGATLGL